MTIPEPSTEAKLWVVQQIAQFINDTEGDGTFRKLIYEYLNLEYADAYDAGGMTITNALYKKQKEFKLSDKIGETEWHLL